MYLEDALAAGDRRELREHFASCEDCRGEIARIAETERRVGRSRGRSRRRLAAMASAAALAAMTLVLPGSGRRPVESLAKAPHVAAPAPGFAPAAQKAPTTTFPAAATIYDWNPGTASQEPRVVWIVDRSLDI